MKAFATRRRSWLRIALMVGVAAIMLVATACSGGGQTPPAGSEPKPDQSGSSAPEAIPGFEALIVVHDLVRGSVNIPDAEKKDKVCVQSSRYLHNEEIVWRIKVIDPKTGQEMDDQALEKVEVVLADGTVLANKYAPHPKQDPVDHFWAVGWDIPEDYPSGTLNYTINAVAKDGRQGQMVSFKVASALLTIMDGSVPKIVKQ